MCAAPRLMKSMLLSQPPAYMSENVSGVSSGRRKNRFSRRSARSREKNGSSVTARQRKLKLSVKKSAMPVGVSVSVKRKNAKSKGKRREKNGGKLVKKEIASGRRSGMQNEVVAARDHESGRIATTATEAATAVHVTIVATEVDTAMTAGDTTVGTGAVGVIARGRERQARSSSQRRRLRDSSRKLWQTSSERAPKQTRSRSLRMRRMRTRSCHHRRHAAPSQLLRFNPSGASLLKHPSPRRQQFLSNPNPRTQLAMCRRKSGTVSHSRPLSLQRQLPARSQKLLLNSRTRARSPP